MEKVIPAFFFLVMGVGIIAVALSRLFGGPGLFGPS